MTELDHWLLLNRTGLAPRIQLALLEHFSSPEAVMEADEEELKRVKGVGPEAAARIISTRSKVDLSTDKRTLERLNLELITLFDDRYPRLLRDIYDPPPVLYMAGEIEPRDELAITIVGSRRASPYGKNVAQNLAKELAGEGVTVVSGLAVGIDSAAHEGALAARGRTIGVVACGIDVDYPRASSDLRKRIISQGALLSELPLGTPPTKWVFLSRNRLLSGLSLGTVVVEAPERSGSLITADHALEQGKHVFAVPGNIESPINKGTHALLREGATLVESAQDILQPLGIETPRLVRSPSGATTAGRRLEPSPAVAVLLTTVEQSIFLSLGGKQKHLDQIASETQLKPAEVSAALMLLELKGLAHRLPGGSFIRG
jgi:DNA processing protein